MPKPPRPPRPAPAPVALPSPLSEDEVDALRQRLDDVPRPLEPLDVSMLDGFLCGVLLQPVGVPASRWLPIVTDADGRALPAGFDAAPLHALVRRRHAELNHAIASREWFDPWVYAAADEEDAEYHGDPQGQDEDESDDFASETVYPWVAGFALAMEHFPALMDLPDEVLTEPLALLFRHLDPDDLEDAEALLAEIELLEPPADLTDAIEELVRATLLLADLSRPVAAPDKPPAAARPRGRPPAAKGTPWGRPGSGRAPKR